MTEKEDGCGWWEVEGEAEVAKLLDDEWATVERFVTAVFYFIFVFVLFYFIFYFISLFFYLYSFIFFSLL